VTDTKPGANPQTYNYTYNADSDLTGQGPIHPWTADPSASLQVTYGYDNADNLTSVSSSNGTYTSTVTRTLDPSSNPTNIAFSVPNYQGVDDRSIRPRMMGRA